MADFTVEVILKRSKSFRADETEKLGSFLVSANQLISSEQEGICGMYLHSLCLLDMVIYDQLNRRKKISIAKIG
jgi:hypothetical protein